MKKMWIQLKETSDRQSLGQQLAEIGKVEWDEQDKNRMILTFHNQSDSGIRMACFRLSEDFIKQFVDFDMIK